MDLREAQKDYEARRLKKHLRFRRCSNCEFVTRIIYSYKCSVKTKMIHNNKKALMCKYYKKQTHDNDNEY